MVAHCCWSVMMWRIFGRRLASGVCAPAVATPAAPARKLLRSKRCSGICAPCVPHCILQATMNSADAPHRRQFVRTALATAASYGQILGANDRIRIGAIGTGGRGQYLLSQLKIAEQNEIVACCDVYEPRRLEAKSKYGSPDASHHLDFRE